MPTQHPLKNHHRAGGTGAGHKGSHWDVPAHLQERKLRPASVYWSQHNAMHGVVKNDPSDAAGGAHFHVHDHEVNGISHRDMTGDSPEFQPIPMSHIAKHDGVVEYHDEPSEEGDGEMATANAENNAPQSSDEKPGYFIWHGALGRLKSAGATPEHFDGHEWQEVPDAAKFFQSAERITAQQAEKLAHEHGVSGEF